MLIGCVIMISKVSNENSVVNRVISAIMGKRVQLSVEFDSFKSYKSWKDGIDFFNTTFESRHYGDHTPFVNLFIGVLNFKVLELAVYNVFHDEDIDEDDELDLDAPYKVEPCFPRKYGYAGKKVCGNCCNYGANAPEHGLTSQCVLNGSGVMPEGLSCGDHFENGIDEFEPFTPLTAGDDV